MKRRRIAAFFFCAFWHTGSSVVVISEEKTFLASIGKEYPFRIFALPSCGASVENCLLGSVEEIETYIGNIESGKSGSIDILTNAVATTAASGDMSKVIVTYEDKEGNETTIEGNFKATVESPVYDNVEKIKDSTKSSGKKVLYGVIAVVIVIALFCICAIRKHRRKKEILDEF